MCRTNIPLDKFPDSNTAICSECTIRNRKQSVRSRQKRHVSLSSEDEDSEDDAVGSLPSQSSFTDPYPLPINSSQPHQHPVPSPVPTSYVRTALKDAEDPLAGPAMSEEHWQYIADFHTALDLIQMEECVECNEKWFDLKVNDAGICKRCLRGTGNIFTAANKLDVGEIPAHLPVLTDIEEMTIARIHTHIQVRQIKGQQYKYSGHTINFMQNTKKLYTKLPLLPSDLDVSSTR